MSEHLLISLGESLAPIALLIAFGYLWKLTAPGGLDALQARRAINLLVMYAFYPGLAYHVVSHARFGADFYWVPLFTWVGLLIAAALAWLVFARSGLFPKLELQLFELKRESIEEGLLTNRYDMAVLLTSNILNPALTTEKLMSSTRRLWVPAQHPLLQRDSVGFREIAEEPYINLAKTLHHADGRRGSALVAEILERLDLPAARQSPDL
eukprot:gene119-166_t